jgi:hypothetical protein
MKRLSAVALLALDASLRSQERDLMEEVSRLYLVSHEHARRLLGYPADLSGQRMTRRLLKQMTDRGILARLDRTVGGVRAGSSGYIYYLGAAGQRLIALAAGQGAIRGRTRPEPGSRFVAHRLAVTEVCVQIREAERGGGLDVMALDAEPDCWRRFQDSVGGRRDLKPDVFSRLGVGAYEESAFIEVDLASESLNVISAKLKIYVDYFRAGTEQAIHGVFPRVVWIVPSEARRAKVLERCLRLPAEARGIFAVTTFEDALGVISGWLLKDQAEAETEALS